jgi:hypothetical protein
MPTFTSTITEAFTATSGSFNSTKTVSISSIEHVTKRVVGCKTAVQTRLATFAAANSTSAASHKIADIKYIRVTNLHGSDTISLGVVGAASSHSLIIAAGESWVIGSPDDAYLAEEDAHPAHAGYADITALEAEKVTSGVAQVEIVIAST